MIEKAKEDRFWESVHKKAGRDVLDIVCDLTSGRATAGETADRIAKRCNIVRKLTLAELESHSAVQPSEFTKNEIENLKNEIKAMVYTYKTQSVLWFEIEKKIDIHATVIDSLEAENKRLKEFARQIIKDYCWELGDPDGGSIQDLAKKLGFIERHIATKEDAEFSNYEVGDTIYKFNELLKENNNE